MHKFIRGLAAGLFIQIYLLLGIFVVTVSLGAFAITALHGQEIYAWVMQQPALAPLTGAVVVLAGLKIDPTGSSSDALFISNGILGMLALSSTAISISVCISILTRASSMLTRGILFWCQWCRSRST
ncbi:hypothetical protein [Achromobacter kerstersii]|uniref:Uncharacterized protein n=1 Tax=Achromobacter kerstersii TaxID=1353890 RepID=A0A6S7AH71_9BURK|nr:hypothetical protein [Achromobacter kerstersii]CAB3732335.1 hypothetical protein LMG3441_04798 [Achromobacter kerstersii]